MCGQSYQNNLFTKSSFQRVVDLRVCEATMYQYVFLVQTLSYHLVVVT